MGSCESLETLTVGGCAQPIVQGDQPTAE
ncbi:expressed unknown protein [Ectocarpus siliculosus]|uniref:Uncharacterized protein n=1 Tax=Ectocarpus siliculosus TaxID=2880 RepID=D7FMB8_ECTSI|nr:expressed unknown protein [Ectocarpus siliculosus]|eukprot:CBJ29936.1 expressed unknown protein [Ectocarpus siliculosus]